MIDPKLAARLTGRDESGLQQLEGGQRLLPEAAEAFLRLQARGRQQGFELAIASSFRSYERQLAIFNGKASGERAVHDEAGEPVPMAGLSEAQRLAAILRFSALPGGSRHHWGTDLDVYDAAALPEGYQVQLTPAEVAPDGLFAGLHDWLDECMASGDSEGFFRPYGEDHGGVAPERWHLSYAPLARPMEQAFSAEVLRACWRESGSEVPYCLDYLETELETLWQRYVRVPASWCPEA